MSYILTRTTGRTSPNTRLPSRGSNNSLDSRCMNKERSNENVSHRIFTGVDRKHRSRRGPRWIVAALSRCEAPGGHGSQEGHFRRGGFHNRFDGPSPWSYRSAAGSGADFSATFAEYRCENGQGRTEI